MSLPAPKPFKRNQRVSELVRNELAKLILRELEFPGALVTITEVDVTPKLDYGRVKVSVIPSSKAKDALGNLNYHRRDLQRSLLRILNIKPMPELSFEIDHGNEKAAEIEKAFIEGEKQGLIEKSEENG